MGKNRAGKGITGRQQAIKAAQPAAEEAASTELQQRVSKKHDQVQHRRPLTRVCFGPEDHAGCGWEVYGGAMAPAEGGKGE